MIFNPIHRAGITFDYMIGSSSGNSISFPWALLSIKMTESAFKSWLSIFESNQFGTVS